MLPRLSAVDLFCGFSPFLPDQELYIMPFKINSHFLTLATLLMPTSAYSYYYYTRKHDEKDELESELREKYRNNITLARSRNEGFEKVFQKMKHGDREHDELLDSLKRGGAKSISRSGGGDDSERPQARGGATAEDAERQIRLRDERIAAAKEKERKRKEERRKGKRRKNDDKSQKISPRADSKDNTRNTLVSVGAVVVCLGGIISIFSSRKN